VTQPRNYDLNRNQVRRIQMLAPSGGGIDYHYFNPLNSMGEGLGIVDFASRLPAGGRSVNSVAFTNDLWGLGFRHELARPVANWSDQIVSSLDGATPFSFSRLDAFSRQTQVGWRTDNSTGDIQTLDYTYDRNDLRTSANRKVSVDDETHAHDGLERLTAFARTGDAPFRQEWELDVSDNWRKFKQDDTGDGTFDLDQERIHVRDNRIIGIVNKTSAQPPPFPWVQPLYDNNGNLKRAPRLDDPTLPLALKYDAWNRVTDVIHGAARLVARNHYDGLNRRVAKEVFEPNGVTINHTRHYYYSDDWQVVEEWVEPRGGVIYPDREYLWVPGSLDELIARIDPPSAGGAGGAETWRWPLQDLNNSTLDLLEQDVNAKAVVAERFRYQAYGKPQFLDAAGSPVTFSASGWDVLFGGYKYEKESGLYLVRNRVFHPTLGRWLQQDPSGYEDSFNLYQYGLSAPGTYTDPSGELIFLALGMLLIGGAGVVAAHHGAHLISEETYRGQPSSSLSRLEPPIWRIGFFARVKVAQTAGCVRPHVGRGQVK